MFFAVKTNNKMEVRSMDYENKITQDNVHYSRYLASFLRVCHERRLSFNYSMFGEWLKRMDLSEDEYKDIMLLSWSGKLEFEEDARKYFDSEFNKLL
jgi:hypothetical protein